MASSHVRVGIKAGYPRVPLPARIKAVVQLVRPFTAFFAFIGGIAIYYALTRHVDTTGIIFALICAGLQAFGQVANQASPQEIYIDIANGKTYRPTASGRLSSKTAWDIAVTIAIITLAMSVLIRPTYFLWVWFALSIAYVYTYEPMRVKRVFVANNVLQGFARGLLPWLLGMFAVGVISTDFVLYGTAMMIWVVGAQTTKDYTDVDGDRKFGIRTFPVVLGTQHATLVMGMFMLLSYVVLFASGAHLIGLLTVPLSCAILVAVSKPTITENALGWTIFYITLGVWFILPAIEVVV